MINYQRPDLPPGFDSEVAALRTTIATLIDESSGRVVQPDKWKSDIFPNRWKRYKSVFNRCQHNKCAYCERSFTGHGDVEHILPKTTVDVLGADGQEGPDLSVSGRTIAQTTRPGFWWLAYDWANYCFACNHCNSKWKKSFVVVSPPFTSQDVPYSGRTQVINFVHPYDDDPAEHMTVDSEGILIGLTTAGKSTIQIVGLNRHSLIQHRHQAYVDALSTAKLTRYKPDEIENLLRQLWPNQQFALSRRTAVKRFFNDDSRYASFQALADEMFENKYGSQQ